MSGMALLVDDVSDNLTIYSEFLAHAGWSVATAPGSADIVTVAAECQPDVIVLADSPRYNCVPAIQRLRDLERFQHTPIYVLTTSMKQADLDALRASYAVVVLRIPFAPALLVSQLQSIIPVIA